MTSRFPSRRRFATLVAAAAFVLFSADLTLAQRRVVVRQHRHGHVVKTLPRGHARVVVRGVTYRAVGSQFYRPHARGWVVVAPPVGAEVRSLPPGARRVLVNGVRYHLHAGVHYLPVVRNGITAYVVVRL